MRKKIRQGGLNPFMPVKITKPHFNIDTDRDGVKDFRDCRPFNKRLQGPEHNDLREFKNKKYEIINLIDEAQEKYFEAINTLREAIKIMDRYKIGNAGHAEAYLLNQLEIHGDSGHGGFLSRDFTFDDLRAEIEQETREDSMDRR